VNSEALDALARRSSSERDGYARPENEAEKQCYKLLGYVDSVASHVEGSTTQQNFQRNEIRSLIIKGVPVFFITFAPPPYKNPICLYFCCLNIDLDHHSERLDTLVGGLSSRRVWYRFYGGCEGQNHSTLFLVFPTTRGL
jgi:hypothetical protein